MVHPYVLLLPAGVRLVHLDNSASGKVTKTLIGEERLWGNKFFVGEGSPLPSIHFGVNIQHPQHVKDIHHIEDEDSTWFRKFLGLFPVGNNHDDTCYQGYATGVHRPAHRFLFLFVDL